MIRKLKLALSATLLICASVANATMLTGTLTVDNSQSVYLSTDDNTQGVLIGTGSNWTVTDSVLGNLIAGTNYYLHVYGENITGPHAFLGDFSLSGTDHVFSNGSNSLLTNTTDWQVSNSGWSNYTTVTSYGLNGVSPWGTRSGIDSNAEWIWTSGSNVRGATAYFTTAITATTNPQSASAPGIVALLLLSIGGIFARRRA